MLRSPRLASFALLLTLGCKRQEQQPSTAALELIPADIQGSYGRMATDAPGMLVTPTGLEFGQLSLTIHAGKMEGDTVRVERATLQWQKLDPKTCNGTIARQGERLLMSLYDSENPEAKCDSVLEAQWFRWEQLDALPELIRGRYAALLIEPDGMHLDLDWVHAELDAELIRELPGSNDERAELLIADAQVSSAELDEQPKTFTCSGTMSLADGRLSTDFWVPAPMIPEPGSEAANDPATRERLAEHQQACDRWDGTATKWTVDLTSLPKRPISTGSLTLDINAERVVLDSQELRCEQPLWRTESVDSRAGWAGVQIGGERMTLGRAEPTRVSEGCALKLRIWCEVQDGAETSAIDPNSEPAEHIAACIDFARQELCPTSITVRALSDTRHKVHVEPPQFNQIACVDPTPDFVLHP